jgi:hypothetical protein
MTRKPTKQTANKQRPTKAKAIIPASLRTFGTLTLTGFTPSRKLSFEETATALLALSRVKGAVQWAAGDLWCSLEASGYGERAAKARDGTFGDFSLQALMDYGSVCRRVTTSSRNEVLSFSHHKAVAALAPDIQRDFLDRAEREHLSVRALYDLIGKSDKFGMPTTDVGPLPPPDHDAPPLAGGNMFDDEADADLAESASYDYEPDPDVGEVEAPTVDPAARAEAMKAAFTAAIHALSKLRLPDAPVLATCTTIEASKLRLYGLLLDHIAATSEGKATPSRLFAHLITALLDLADEAPATLAGELSPDDLNEAVALIGRVIAASSDSNEPGHVLQARA